MTFNFDYTLSWFNEYFAARKKVEGVDLMAFYLIFMKYGMRLYG